MCELVACICRVKYRTDVDVASSRELVERGQTTAMSTKLLPSAISRPNFQKVDIPANLGLHSEGPHEKSIIRARVHPTSSAFASCARARASVCTSKVERTSIPVVIFQVAAGMQIGRKMEKKKKKKEETVRVRSCILQRE